MKKILSTIALALSLVLTAPVVLPQTAVVAEAATKTTVNCYNNVIGINATTQIDLYDKKAKATYSFSSSKKSVATVSSKGVVTGKATGKAKITVKQKYKGKTTTVGTVTITVKKASLIRGMMNTSEPEIWCASQPGWISKEDPINLDITEYIDCKNPKAKYYVYADNNDIVISKTGKVTAVNKSGFTYVTVKETYKGKTRTLGKAVIELRAPFLWSTDGPTMLYMGDDYVDVYSVVGAIGALYFRWYEEKPTAEQVLLDTAEDIASGNEPSEDDVLSMVLNDKGEWEGIIKAKAPGTRYCAVVQYNYLTKTYDKVVAEFTICVPDTSKATELRLPWDDPEYESGYYDKATNTKTGDIWDEYEYVYVYVSPERYSGGFEVTSSNPSVVSVTYEDDGYGEVCLKLEYLSGGTSTITVKANGVEKSFNVNVLGDDEDDEDDF